MKVILDISSIGDNIKNRTGVARVAWTLTTLLHQKLGDDLSFSATGSINASLQAERLLESEPHLRSAVYPVNFLARNIDRLNTQFTNSPSNLFEQTKQSTLVNISRVFNLTRQPIDPSILAEADLFHSTYPRIPQQVRKNLPRRHLQTVYDLTPLILDERYVSPNLKGVCRRLIDTIQFDDWVTTISNSARNDLLERRKLNSERVITTYLAASPELFYPVTDSMVIQAVKQKYDLPEGDYFLSLHSLAPHKNMGHLIDCFRQLLLQEKIKDLHLVICGGNTDAVATMINDNQLTSAEQKHIHFTGFVEDRDLAAMYSGALGFIFPSLYEGFGLPLLEAMQCGCPVISSNTSSMPEVVGDAGFLVPPEDRDNLCDAMLQIYRNREFQFKYSQQSLTRAALFSWEKTLDDTLEIYQKIVSI